MNSAKRANLTKPRPAGSLKDAAATLIEAVGIDRARDLTGKGKTAIYGYGDPDSGRHMPLDVVAALTRDSGCLAVATYLAAEAGAVVTPAPAAAPSAGLADMIAGLGGKIGAAFAHYAAAISDGHISAAEAETLKADFRGVVDEAMAAFSAISPDAGEPPSNVTRLGG